MRIQVLRVDDPEGHILCDTPGGRLTAAWRGDTRPAPGDAADVEIDAVGNLRWGTTVTVIDQVAQSPLANTFIGVAEEVHGDEVLVRADGLLRITVGGSVPDNIVGQSVAVSPESFELWPTGI
jgi:hypothetical protein